MTENEDATAIECAVCGSATDAENVYQVSYGTDMVCDDCVRVCEHCDDIGTENDFFPIVDGERWCESCVNNYAHWCDSCEEYSQESTYWIRDRGSSWCSDCASNNAVWCEDCDEYYESGCEECNSNKVIHDYSYRPDPIFHSTDKNERLFFGIEIEMEARNSFREASEYAHQLEGLEMAYLKYDGSLACGFELVTHPMSHDFLKNEAHDLFRVLTGLRDTYKVASWGTNTCGVHIHISRTGFNGGPHMHRFLNLVYSNQALYEALAGRSSTRWAKFDDVEVMNYERDADGRRVLDEWGNRVYKKHRSFTLKLENNRQSDRYSAVNTQNAHTLEIRIFKGTTKPETIKSHIDLAHASVEYTRTLSVQQVRSGALSADPFMTYIESHADLYPELNERMSRLITPSVRLAEQNVSA
jgi:hypothetical protein